jgi:hypothetical protein
MVEWHAASRASLGKKCIENHNNLLLIKVSMGLQHDAGGERDVSMVSMDRIKDIAVTGDFLLRAISRDRLLGNQILNTLQGAVIPSSRLEDSVLCIIAA